jgi:hypothetical protein
MFHRSFLHDLSKRVLECQSENAPAGANGHPMSDLVFSLIPVALGVVLSPLAIMALVAVRLSRRSSHLPAPH